MSLILTLVLANWLSSGLLQASESASPRCLMAPKVWTSDLQDNGFSRLPVCGLSGTRKDIPSDGWTHRKSKAGDLSVHVDGPGGSGRFWTVVVGVPETQEVKPAHGICVSTTTVGWRTLRDYSKGPLPWLEDVNGDGSAEFIL